MLQYVHLLLVADLLFRWKTQHIFQAKRGIVDQTKVALLDPKLKLGATRFSGRIVLQKSDNILPLLS